jgi:predicted porin
MFNVSNAMIRFSTCALALAAAVAAMPAKADQTLYGTLDLNFSSYRPSTPENKLPRNLASSGGKTHRVQAVDYDGMSQSFVGFSGTEKLNDDLTARFVLETSLRGDTGASSADGFWSRNAYVGLDSAYGQIKLGRAQTVFFDTLAAFSPFGESSNSPAVLMMMGNPHTTYAYQVQLFTAGVSVDEVDAVKGVLSSRSWGNSISYQSPELDGLSVAVQMGLKEGDANGGNHAVAVRANGDELQAALAFQSVKSGLPAGFDPVNTRWVFGVSYDFGLLVAYAQGGQDRLQQNVAGKTGAVRSNYLQFGAKVPVTTKGDVLVSLGRSNNKPLDATFVMMVLGYDHHLSLRSDAYAQLILDKAQLAGVEDDMGVSLALGLRHRF